MPVYIGGTIQMIDPRNATCATGEVKTGNTYYAGSTTMSTGSGTQTLSDASEAVAAGYYAATTLSTIDAQLAAGNIGVDIVVFGITGTMAFTQSEDITGSAKTTTNADDTGTFGFNDISIDIETETTLATKTQNYDANSIAVAVGVAACKAETISKLILRLYMGGTLVTSSSYIPATVDTIIVVGTRALSGSQECKLVVYNTDGASAYNLTAYSEDSGSVLPFAIGCGSIKIT